MRSNWFRYTVVAIVCLGLGAYGHRIKRKLTAEEPKAKAIMPLSVKSVSPRVDLEQLHSLGYVATSVR
jgi:hypothetical protein